MSKYPKIDTLWKRDENNNIIEGNFSKEEFSSVDFWDITEKIDGTNIRVIYSSRVPTGHKGIFEFRGKTDNAQIPKPLLEYLKKNITLKKIFDVFDTDNSTTIILYGEGYGGKIQSVGKKYRKDVSFILFDVNIDGWWLEQKNVRDIAKKLGVGVVPDFGTMLTEEAINFLKEENKSRVSKEELISEGIVARSSPLMLFRDGTPIMWKLKVKDYRKLKNYKKLTLVEVNMR